MVKYSEGELNAVFHALADPTRRRIVDALGDGEQTVGELAAPLSISLPAVSKHLGVLERAGLLHRRREGRTHHLRFEPETLGMAVEWIEEHRRIWERSFDNLTSYLKQTANAKAESHD